jgi:hypothetical protein
MSADSTFLTVRDAEILHHAATVYLASDGQAGYRDEHGRSWGDILDTISGISNPNIRQEDCRRHAYPGLGVWYENGGRYDFNREREVRNAMYVLADKLREGDND